MLGFYRLDENDIEKLPENSVNIEDNIYVLCCPIVTNEPLPKDLDCLYRTLNIPILNIDELQNYNEINYKETINFINELSEYLKLNTEIELLEEGVVGHTLKVGRYAHELCASINLSEKETRKIYIAAILHDIGKINIPSKIISKPEKLSAKEYEIMKTHCLNAKYILDDFLDDETIEIIVTHHERCNKSGYPYGIIPNLGTKIIGISDSYNAMLSKRVYKKQKTLKATLEELIRYSLDESKGGQGILYDEYLVRKFVDLHGYGILSIK